MIKKGFSYHFAFNQNSDLLPGNHKYIRITKQEKEHFLIIQETLLRGIKCSITKYDLFFWFQ